jgi:hypothetical protein
MATKEKQRKAIPFDPDLSELPDKNGTPVRVGDWVKNERGEVWQVETLKPREEGNPDRWSKTGTGKLDQVHSGFWVHQHRLHGSDTMLGAGFIEGMNFQGTVQTSQSVSDVEKLELSPLQLAEMELESAETELHNVEEAELGLRRRKRQVTRRHHEALEKVERLRKEVK